MADRTNRRTLKQSPNTAFITGLLLVVFVLLIGGCSFQHAYSLRDNSFMNSDKFGVIVLSVRRPYYGLARPTPTYRIRSKGGRVYTIISKYSKSAASFMTDGFGFVETLELPAGEYEIFNWDMFFNLGLSQWYEHARSTFSIPFRVEPGKVNYLGEVALDDYLFKFRDMKDRDLQIVLKNYPFLSKAEIIYYPLSCATECQTSPKMGEQTIHTPIIPPHK